MAKYTVRTRLLHSGETYLPGSEVDLDADTARDLILLSVVESIGEAKVAQPEVTQPEATQPEVTQAEAAPPVVSKVTRKKKEEPDTEAAGGVAKDDQANG